jgi:hypothetical protein
MSDISLSGANLGINWEKSKFSSNYFHFIAQIRTFLSKLLKKTGKYLHINRIMCTFATVNQK